MKTEQEERASYDAVAKNVKKGMGVGAAIDSTGLFTSRASFYHIMDKWNLPRFQPSRINHTARPKPATNGHTNGKMVTFTPSGEGMERIEIETTNGIKIRVPFTTEVWADLVRGFTMPATEA